MCGIYGRWHLDGAPVDPALVERATTTLRHRGPNDEGYLFAATTAGRYVQAGGADTDARLGAPRVDTLRGERFDFAFGFRRLSIVDLSPLGHQPMPSADGRYWLVFNGEVYNYRELRDELRGHGHAFRGGSDTEVILAAYQQWGAECLHRFNGMWAIAIWDTRDQTLFLARDRFGVKPLHYVRSGGLFAFASEIKALVGAHGVPFVPNDSAVYHYLLTGALPSPEGGTTFFDGVCAVPPGHAMRVGRGQFELRRFYTLPETDSAEGASAAEAVERYRELFTDAVKLRLRADVPVGTCLSGGVDSSSIVCVVNRMMTADGVDAAQIGDRQKTFSAVYETAGRYNESEHIEKVLAATGAERNYTIPTADRLRADLERLVWHQDEPFGSTSIFAQWCVMAKVRERGVTVLLDGQGADEVLAGYRPFDIALADMLRRGRYARALASASAIRDKTGLSSGSLLARALVRQLPSAPLDYARRRRALSGGGVLRPEFAAAHRESPRYSPVNSSLPDYLRELIHETSLPHLLRYEDRNSMAFSVEGRVPFLDYRLVEYALTAAAPWSIKDGWTKWVLREGMRDVVPEEIIWRRDKVGFETPERRWLATWFAEDADTLADGARIGRYLDLETARAEVRRWSAGGGDSRRVWRWLNTELWLRAFE